MKQILLCYIKWVCHTGMPIDPLIDDWHANGNPFKAVGMWIG